MGFGGTLSRRIKRVIDVVVAATGLVVLAPLVAAVAITVRVAMGSPVFFRQVRPGLQARPFELVKFRTMGSERDVSGRPVDARKRISPLGRLLRRMSLDELPQLWNILKGDISLVGPRPLLLEYLPRYSPEQARRHEMRPGLTGWAQVHGRGMAHWHERFALDVWYVDHWSLALDLKIIALTAKMVVRGEGVEGRAPWDGAN